MSSSNTSVPVLEFQKFSTNPAEIDLDLATTQNRGIIDLQRKQHGAMAECLSHRSETEEKDKKISRLEHYAFDENDLIDFPPSTLMMIFNHFKALGSFENMLRVYEQCENDEFRSSSIVCEFCAVACNKTNQPDRTLELCNDLVKEGQVNGEVYGAMGKAHLVKRETEKSLEAYENGYLMDFDYYPGVNVVYRLLELGQVERAKRVAQMVYLSCERDGGVESEDYWCVVTMLELACIAEKDATAIKDITTKVLSVATATWEIESTLSNLEKLAPPNSANREAIDALRQHLDDIKNFSQEQLQEKQSRLGKDFATTTIEKNFLPEMWRANSFSYRGLSSNFVGGNFDFGGDLSDHAINRTDRGQIETLLSTPIAEMIDLSCLKYSQEEARQILSGAPASLMDVADIDQFLKIVDIFLRSTFETEKLDLENLQSDGHKVYDKTLRGLVQTGGVADGAKKGVDSRTNISTSLALGLGDCRHHAQAKQLLFDMWQKVHVNKLLRQAYDEIASGDFEQYQYLLSQVEEIQRYELRTFDFVVNAPIQMNGKYDARRSEEGEYLMNSEGPEEVEDHTMNLLLTTDENGGVKVRFADAFYHRHYQWADGEIDPQDITAQNGISAGVLHALDTDSDTIQSIPVHLKPTPYAGKRDKPAPDEYGQLLLMGKPVGDLDLVKTLTKGRRGISEFRDNLLHKANGES